MESKNFNWDASAYFRGLAERNKLAQAEGFTFCEVSSLSGFEEALQNMQESTALICVSDISNGWTSIVNSPHTRRVKSVFLAMRHEAENMEQRMACLEKMRELFRQFMSAFIQEKTRLEQQRIYPDPRISFNEIDRYFFSGCACAYFQISVDTFTDLRFNADEWT